MVGMVATPVLTDNVETFDLTQRRVAQAVASGKKDVHGEAEGMVGSPDQLDKFNHPSTVILCKDIADILVKRYPGWAWAVQPQEFGQVINIFNLNLHTHYGFTIRMDDIMNDPRRRWAVRAGHEILRRFRMPDRMSRTVLAEAPRDLHGQCIPDISDFKSKKEKQRAEIALGLATGKMHVVTDEHGRKYLRVNHS